MGITIGRKGWEFPAAAGKAHRASLNEGAGEAPLHAEAEPEPAGKPGWMAGLFKSSPKRRELAEAFALTMFLLVIAVGIVLFRS